MENTFLPWCFWGRITSKFIKILSDCLPDDHGFRFIFFYHEGDDLRFHFFGHSNPQVGIFGRFLFHVGTMYHKIFHVQLNIFLATIPFVTQTGYMQKVKRLSEDVRFRVAPAVHAQLKGIADQREISVSYVARQAIRKYIAAHKRSTRSNQGDRE